MSKKDWVTFGMWWEWASTQTWWKLFLRDRKVADLVDPDVFVPEIKQYVLNKTGKKPLP